MLYTIKNDEIILSVSSFAAEMHSLKRTNDDYEYLWNGDPKYWKGRNPILFPQVGSTSSKLNVIYGKEYPMGNHGFTRNSEFEFVAKSDDSLTLLLRDNEETFKQYPFHFELYVTYKLTSDGVSVNYEVKNVDAVSFPFGFGLHPAFNVTNDYVDTKIVFDDGKELALSSQLFKQYPTYYQKPMPKSAILYTNNHQVKLDFKDFKYLAVWSPFAPFVCIEPWMSLGAKDNVAFEERDDNITLKPNESFKIAYSISVL